MRSNMVGTCKPAAALRGSRAWLPLALFVLLAIASRLPAAMQFDVFIGYDGVVPEDSWYPVLCEIKNDAAPFKGVIIVTPTEGYGQGLRREIPVELPTGTLKRITIPVFGGSQYYATWDITLVDDRGKVRAERTREAATRVVPSGTPLLGAIMRNAGAKPLIRPLASQQNQQQPPSAAMLPAILPDNPLVLEGMTSLYLSSMRAPELRDPDQVQALYAWLNAGGHLIVGVEQLADVRSLKWLDALFPIEIRDIKPVSQHSELQRWISSTGWITNSSANNYPRPRPRPRRSGNSPAPMVIQPEDSSGSVSQETADDTKFEAAPLQVAVGKLRDGKVVVPDPDEHSDTPPLIVTAERGRGRITVVLFSPEREPFSQWRNAPTFWAKLTDIPANWYVHQNTVAGQSSDAIFGAMIDSRQVHKLPVEWLLVLLIVYLIVIGPLDRYWLKKINRPMLTWITFPCYVVAFSLLIYLIGYKLRAGEAEWNELHVVDVLSNGDKAELRGRTYASIYAPSNQRYLLESAQKFATLRGEYFGVQGGAERNDKATVIQMGDTFKGEIFVPVWTSKLFVSDWWEPADVPLAATVEKQADGWTVNVENHTEQKISNVALVIDGSLYHLGEIGASQTKPFQVNRERGTSLKDWVSGREREFHNVAGSRQNAFGNTESGRINDLPDSVVAASFLSSAQQGDNYMGKFSSPPGLDLSDELAANTAIVFAWTENYSPVKALYNFQPKRAHKNTMFRLPAKVQSPTSKVQSLNSEVKRPKSKVQS